MLYRVQIIIDIIVCHDLNISCEYLLKEISILIVFVYYNVLFIYFENGNVKWRRYDVVRRGGVKIISIIHCLTVIHSLILRTLLRATTVFN